VNNSGTALACPLCLTNFSHVRDTESHTSPVFGYGLDFRLLPRDCNRSSDIAVCPECLFTARVQDFNQRVPGHVKELVRSQKYVRILNSRTGVDFLAAAWQALVSIMETRGLNPRDLGVLSLRGSWAARELGELEIEDDMLKSSDAFLDDALRRGLTKGDPGMVMYLLGEINRRRGEFFRAKEMLTFLGNNPRYRYPALLQTVLIEEEDTTPYWSLHSPDQMEVHSSRFKGLFPALRSIPPKKTEFSAEELKEPSEKSDEDDRKRF
jgi:uncharacterized protein (DUF2225 family)